MNSIVISLGSILQYTFVYMDICSKGGSWMVWGEMRNEPFHKDATL